MNLKVVQEVVVPKVTAGIPEIEGVMSNTKQGIIKHPPIFYSKDKITSLEAGTCTVYPNILQIESMPNVIRP